MWSYTPMYVAGVERGVRPIGVWSTSSTRSTVSQPVSSAQPEGAGGEVYLAAVGLGSADVNWMTMFMLLPMRHRPTEQSRLLRM